MKAKSRTLLAFVYLTAGYWIFGFLLQFALLPFTQAGPGFSVSSAQGVHEVRFHGRPGDLVLLLSVYTSGDKVLQYQTASHGSTGISSSYRFANAYADLACVCLFALISLPILKRMLHPETNQRTRAYGHHPSSSAHDDRNP